VALGGQAPGDGVLPAAASNDKNFHVEELV
jgi:hypothetical protein